MSGGVVQFSMSGIPRGQGRPRATVRKGGFASVYKDSKSRQYELSIAKIAKIAMAGRPPLTGALSASFRFRLQIPKSMPKWLQAKVLAGEEAYLGAFDTSNMIKAVEDAMNKVVFKDDKQIVRLFATKVAAANPGVDVRIEPLIPQDGAAA